jgi:hypothetical protein
MSKYAMFCAEFEMNYKVIGVIIIKKCSVSAYAKVHISILKMRNIYMELLKNSFMRERKRREKDEKNQTVDSNGVSDCYGNVSICMRVRQKQYC